MDQHVVALMQKAPSKQGRGLAAGPAGAARTMRAAAVAVGSGAFRGAWGGAARTVRVTAATAGGPVVPGPGGGHGSGEGGCQILTKIDYKKMKNKHR